VEKYITQAEKLYRDDISGNRQMGEFGANAILSDKSKKVKILTHCNTGSLATGGFGTALGVIRTIYAKDRLEHAFCTETRPYNQGARLTAFELVYDKIPATLVTDSMVSALLKQKGIDAIVVGADRITANGDTANKIGTYQVAITAKFHGVPFYVAAPTTSIDVKLANGSLIPIEERPKNELTHIQGIEIAASGIGVWNPGFDVTPASLITGIITEVGVITKADKDAEFNVIEFLKKHNKL